MKILTKEIKAYQYHELEEYAKEQARADYLSKEHLPEFFSLDIKMELKERFGLFNLDTYYSLSSCQGDGLCLYGKIYYKELFENENFRKIAFKCIHHKQVQSVKDELQGIDFIHSSRYYHSKTVSIKSHEYNPTDKQELIIEKIIDNVKQWYFAFCKEWENRGYDYFYEISEEVMSAICEEQEHLFEEDGHLIDEYEYKELTA
jgi:hypothetical protein